MLMSCRNRMVSVGLFALLLPMAPDSQSQQQRRPAAPAPPQSAPISNIRSDLTFDSTTASKRTIQVAMSLDVSGPGPILLSLPAWTPGAYEISNFARWVVGFSATAGNSPVDWDKLD